jgi:ribosomal protein S12 methylthiotransferase accessory factor
VESAGGEGGLDQTRPDSGLAVVKVVVPGLRHFRPQLAPGRLYDVPVVLGWRSRPARESELNPAIPFLS